MRWEVADISDLGEDPGDELGGRLGEGIGGQRGDDGHGLPDQGGGGGHGADDGALLALVVLIDGVEDAGDVLGGETGANGEEEFSAESVAHA